MAPSSKSLLIALLVALAISLQPSAAFEIRIPPFPCIPGLPDIWFIPCYNATPAPPMKEITECWTPVMKMMPCAGFLTNASIHGGLERVLQRLQVGPRRRSRHLLLPHWERRHRQTSAGAFEFHTLVLPPEGVS
ncbi:hypothetical protein HU200_008970 [Digitaria exilis]|uniref:Uncharacterized protein n=1 Tax=Digitaria exilis TaxID=1010633 RepID=A0A835FKR9_9POAL|nr:hypothetical protein HU200_008970 [Digitaria exilis]